MCVSRWPSVNGSGCATGTVREETVADVRKNPPPLDDIKAAANQLVADLEKLPPSERKDFLLAQVRALAVRADLMNHIRHQQPTPGFDQQTEGFFGVRVPPVATENFDAMRHEVAGLLGGAGKLADRYAAFEQQFVVPPDRLPEVMGRALALCREQTRVHLTLPPGEDAQIEFVRNKPWSGFSHYKGHFHSVIEVNADLGLTVDRALRLACHEGYPGHHVFNSLTEQAAGGARIELSVQPTFSPQSYASEALATVGADIAFTDGERLKVERDVLFPMAGIGGATSSAI